MSYKQNSSRLIRLPDFFGITDSSGLMPLSRIWDNGIINNGDRRKDQEESKKSVMETLKEKKQEARAAEAAKPKPPAKDKDQAVDLS